MYLVFYIWFLITHHITDAVQFVVLYINYYLVLSFNSLETSTVLYDVELEIVHRQLFPSLLNLFSSRAVVIKLVGKLVSLFWSMLLIWKNVNLNSEICCCSTMRYSYIILYFFDTITVAQVISTWLNLYMKNEDTLFTPFIKIIMHCLLLI